jgi:hypothetical protein
MWPLARPAGFFALVLAASPASAGLLSGTGIFVKDSGGAQRVQYSNNERVTLTARINNAVASANRVQFTFRIAGPSGAEVFFHGGNSVPGTAGNSASQVSGIPISQFFTGPGLYSFTANAVLDAQTVSQNITFAVSSPNIILIYPPSGARDVADRPVTFRWSASGAARYRVTVGDNPALYNAVFSESTGGPESFLAYPDNPSDSRARLAAGQVYYWKVEGLDAAGNVIAQSETPYNFSAQTAALTRDLSVTDLEATGRDGMTLSFLVRVANQGGTTEANVPLRMSLGGLPAPGSPLALPQLRPGDVREYPFSAALPSDQGQSLAIACVEFFDDSVPNNCKSIQVTKPTDASGDSGFGQTGVLTKEQLWEALKQKLIELGMDMDEYEASEMSQQLSAGDMQALLDQLGKGLVQISLSGPPPGAAPPPAFIPPPVSGAPSAPGAPAPPPVVKTDEAWAALAEKLLGLGVDVGDYAVVGMEPELTTEDLELLLEQLAKGTAQASVSGPPPGAAPLPTVIPPPVSAPTPAAPAPVAVPSQNAVGREFAGIAVSDFGEKGLFTVVREAKGFGRVWGKLSQADAPEFDFKQVMVVVVVAGTKADADRVEVEDVMEGLDGLIVRYRVVGKGPNVRLPGAPRRRGVPYMVKVVRASGLEAKFDDLGRGGR